MKYLTLVFILISINLMAYDQSNLPKNNLINNLTPQQSTTGDTRPDNVSSGIITETLRTQIVINNVPSYLWQHGCGPTALGMVIGYYNDVGFSSLVDGSAATQTTSVNNAIANPEHYSDYSQPIDYYPDLFADLSEGGDAHESDCIADFMETSWSSEENRYGWSWSNLINIAFTNYVLSKNSNYYTNVSYNWYSGSSWNTYKTEIDNDRPVVLLVDSNGDGYTDHFVTGIGYDESNSTYAIYDTWDNGIHWYQWRGMSSSYQWGIYGFSIMEMGSNITNPENVIISSDAGSIQLNWNAVAGATGYSVYSDNDPKGDFSTLEWSGIGTSWNETSSDTKKFYLVKALD